MTSDRSEGTLESMRAAKSIGMPVRETGRGAQPEPRPAEPLPPWELYQAWRAAFEETEQALADWRSGPVANRADAYAVYRAAADREDAAAAHWFTA